MTRIILAISLMLIISYKNCNGQMEGMQCFKCLQCPTNLERAFYYYCQNCFMNPYMCFKKCQDLMSCISFCPEECPTQFVFRSQFQETIRQSRPPPPPRRRNNFRRRPPMGRWDRNRRPMTMNRRRQRPMNRQLPMTMLFNYS